MWVTAWWVGISSCQLAASMVAMFPGEGELQRQGHGQARDDTRDALGSTDRWGRRYVVGRPRRDVGGMTLATYPGMPENKPDQKDTKPVEKPADKPGERHRDEQREGGGPRYAGRDWDVADERGDKRFGVARTDDANPSELEPAEIAEDGGPVDED